ncbi:MAG: HlyD family efflux transporter periplasmic adaptor subunit, partial [Candidatus Pacebacteria bacterium]|nr:HlyD family efflux transporter periplasmic adaptor subunit [Candidatus Paceibacterota bacterium]
SIIVLVIIMGILYYFITKNNKTEEYISPTREYIRKVISVSGKIVPNQDISATFLTGGIVQDIYVNESDSVKAGQKLAKLNTDSIESKLRQQEIALKIENLKLSQLQDDVNGGIINTNLDNYNKELSDIKSKDNSLLLQTQGNISSVLDNTLIGLFDSDNSNNYTFKFISCDQLLQSKIENQRSDISKITVNDLISAKQKLLNINDFLDGLIKIFSSDCMKSSDYIVIRNNLTLTKNTILSNINNIEQRDTNVLQKQNQITSAQKNKNDNSNVLNKNSIETEKLLIEQIKSVIKDLQTQYNQSFIISPVDGEVGNIIIKKGQNTEANKRVMRIVSKGYQIESLLSEADVVYTNVGQAVSIKLDAYDFTLTGNVSEVYKIPEDDKTNIFYKVKIHINPDERIKIGMSATADISVQEKSNVLTLPFSAIKKDEKDNYFALNDKGQKILLTTGIRANNKTEIISGLNDTDKVLTLNK